MPRFNIAAAVTPQIGYFWYDLSRLVFQDCSTGVCKLRLSDGTEVAPRGCNALGANQASAWVAWLGGYGVFDSFGRYFPASDVAMNVPGDAAMGPDGSYAIKVNRNSFGPWDVLMPDGSRWRLTDGDAKDIQILSGRRALYRDPLGIVRANFKLVGRPSGPCTAPRAADDGMLLYQRQPDGALMLGRKEIMPPGFYYGIDQLLLGNEYHVTWSPTAADTNAQVRRYAVADIISTPDPPYITNEDPMPKKCEVTVDAFALSPANHLPDGTLLEFHDRENTYGAHVKVWVEQGSARMSIDYPGAGPGLKGETGARRPVR